MHVEMEGKAGLRVCARALRLLGCRVVQVRGRGFLSRARASSVVVNRARTEVESCVWQGVKWKVQRLFEREHYETPKSTPILYNDRPNLSGIKPSYPTENCPCLFHIPSSLSHTLIPAVMPFSYPIS